MEYLKLFVIVLAATLAVDAAKAALRHWRG